MLQEVIGDETPKVPVGVEDFRQVMRQLAGCVTVITTECDGTNYGFTATAVCSVCAEPATILIAVNKSARTHPYIDKKGAFAVNILSEGQKGTAEHFASKGDNQFDSVRYRAGLNGVPLLLGAAAHLECEVRERIQIGSHTLFVAHVMGTGVDRRAPLVYHDGRYGLIAHM